MSITLPNELIKAVRAKVASGAYASESEVIRDGLRTLIARYRCLHEQVGPGYDALKADPSRAITPQRVRGRAPERPRQEVNEDIRRG